jgi:hypothetical protein
MSKIISALAFATLLSLPTSAAVTREVTAPRILVTNASASCPANEGYPDCHPDRSPGWTSYREYVRGRSR